MRFKVVLALKVAVLRWWTAALFGPTSTAELESLEQRREERTERLEQRLEREERRREERREDRDQLRVMLAR